MRVRSPVNVADLETMTTPSASMPTKSRPIAVVDENRVRRVIQLTPATMTAAATAAPSIPGDSEQDRDRDTGQHAVAERFADERESLAG